MSVPMRTWCEPAGSDRLTQGAFVVADRRPLRALSECGYAIAIAPKFFTLRLDDPTDEPTEVAHGARDGRSPLLPVGA